MAHEYLVQKWLDGKAGTWQRISANSKLDAAERVTGIKLRTVGALGDLRARAFDDGSSTDVYEISHGDRLIGKKTVRHPATGSVVKIAYHLGDESFDNSDAFMASFLKAQEENA